MTVIKVGSRKGLAMRFRKAPIAALLVLALVAACGGDEDPSGYSGTGENIEKTAHSGYN